MTSVELGQKCWLVSSMYVRHNQTRLASKALFLPDEQIISQKTGLFSKCQGVSQENNIWSKAAGPRCRAITNQKKSWLNVDIPFWLVIYGRSKWYFLVRKIVVRLYFLLEQRLLPEYFYYEIFSKYHLTHATKDIIDYIVKLVHYTTMSVWQVQ